MGRACARSRRSRVGAQGHGDSGTVVSPMQGTVLKVDVAEDAIVTEGQVLCVVEAMKMENEVVSPCDGAVTGLSIAVGDAVTHGQVICVVVPEAG